MWQCLYVDCAFGVRAFFFKACFDMDTSPIFPQGMLNAITLLGWLVLGDLKPVQSERWDFLSAKRSSLPCPGWGPFDGTSQFSDLLPGPLFSVSLRERESRRPLHHMCSVQFSFHHRKRPPPVSGVSTVLGLSASAVGSWGPHLGPLEPHLQYLYAPLLASVCFCF